MNTYYEPIFFRILRFFYYTFIYTLMFGMGVLMKGYWFAFFVVIIWFFYVVHYNYLGGQSITIAPDGIFYYIKPFQKIQVGWDGFQKTGKILFREGLFIKESYLIANGKALYITFIPLSTFAKNWRDSDLGQQIKQYAPHLFEKEKSAQSAEEEF
ncbi:MAG TPA: hypothetical protein DCG54_13015 [Anaerolineae bacterium]|nr:hypothetical protein [Anaerolineae bacterium]